MADPACAPIGSAPAGGAYSQALAYSGNDGKIGNLTSKAGVSQTYNVPSPATGCVTGAPATKPHAPASAGSDTYSYDCTGNMTSRIQSGVTYTQNFDADAAP